MTEVQVYILSNADCQAIFPLNSGCPRGPQIIICDYGAGPCVEETVIDNPTYADWKIALEAILPFSSRTTVTVTIEED
jgi:hypothetical protein